MNINDFKEIFMEKLIINIKFLTIKTIFLYNNTLHTYIGFNMVSGDISDTFLPTAYGSLSLTYSYKITQLCQ